MLQQKKFEIPNKRSKTFLKRPKGFDAISFIMEKYLNKWDVPKKTSVVEFAEKYFEKVVEKTISGEIRMILPHNLGYMQVLEHQYTGKSVEHLKEFGNKDYSLVWIRSPLFIHQRIKASKELNEKVRQKKRDGTNYLTEYVDGDTYVG